MAKETRVDIKVGDVGTEYCIPIGDDDLTPTTFNPTEASRKLLRFRQPGASGLCVRNAETKQIVINGVPTWCLTYTVVEADVQSYVDESTGGFHQQAGRIKVEAYLEFATGQKWSSSIAEADARGRELRVSARLV